MNCLRQLCLQDAEQQNAAPDRTLLMRLRFLPFAAYVVLLAEQLWLEAMDKVSKRKLATGLTPGGAAFFSTFDTSQLLQPLAPAAGLFALPRLLLRLRRPPDTRWPQAARAGVNHEGSFLFPTFGSVQS